VNYINVIKELGTFLAIMNPFLILPVFLSMTSGLSVHNQRILAAKITILSSIMCLIILFAGKVSSVSLASPLISSVSPGELS
jgi:multiple antibiotic resistance protein